MKTNISLIPYPHYIEQKNNSLTTEKKFILNTDSFFENDAVFLSKQLTTINSTCTVSNTKATGICIELKKKTSLDGKDLKNKESYVLIIDEKKISIYASNSAGAFYAVQTLKQLLLTRAEELPCVYIYDKPAFEWRGFMLDLSRAFYSLDFLKKMVDVIALHKMNRFHIHLTDDQGWRIEVPEYPNLTKIGSVRKGHYASNHNDVMNGTFRDKMIFYYTDKELKDLVQYALVRHIEVVPEIELPGHVMALLASYPELGCTGGPYEVENRWGIFDNVLCLGNDKIFDVYTAVFKKVAKLFPSKWIHIGGDECPSTKWKTCPICQQRVKDLKLKSEKELQSWVTKKMSDIVLSLGKTPIAWDEVINNTEKYSLPKDVIVQSWRDSNGGKRAAEMNHKTILSPCNMVYLNYKHNSDYDEPGKLDVITTKKAYSFSPVPKGLEGEKENLVMGAECNMWAEDVSSAKLAEYMIFPRLCAVSECMWLTKKEKSFARFKKNLDEHKKRLSSLDFLYYNGRLE